LSLNQKNAVVTSAKSRIGVTYQMGGTGPGGYDCSGLTSTVIKESLGISLPRTSRDQYSVGRDIPFANLGVGDLVFFATNGGTNISHVGIITDISGGDIKMTHANSYEGRVKEETIKSVAYWQKTYVGAREITEATKDLVAPATPDPTYKSPVAKTAPDEYNGYFPPSERNDPRLKVGAANIQVPGTTTKVITESDLKATTTPSATPTVTATATPTATQTAKATVTASPTVTTTAKPTTTQTPVTNSPTATATPSPIQNSSRTEIRDKIQNFPDVSTTYYAYDAIEKLSALGVINGYHDGSFRPEASVSRAELTKMVYIALDKEARGLSSNPFSDVDSEDGLSKYVLSAYRDGLVKGYRDFTFHPQSSVTKAEGSKIILKAFVVAPERANQEFDDMDTLGDLKNYMGYMLNHALLPSADHLARPDTPLTRAQAAYILAALIK